jgi:hypothetical protein
MEEVIGSIPIRSTKYFNTYGFSENPEGPISGSGANGGSPFGSVVIQYLTLPI